MIPNLTLVVLVGVLFATGAYLLLARSLTRVLIGVLLLGNGVNVLILSAGGPAGLAPLLGKAAPEDMSDPLPQALILTAIVITFGMMTFLLALAHRSWQLFGHDEVPDDPEDRRIRERAEHEQLDHELEELTDPDSPESVEDSDFDEDGVRR